MTTYVCPECVQGKCQNCDGSAWDTEADQPTACLCSHRTVSRKPEVTEHRPTATLQVDIFPEDSFLLDEPEDLDACANGCTCDQRYTADDVAREAWSSIGDWWQQGYLPVITVIMPDGSEHTVDLERVERERLSE